MIKILKGHGGGKDGGGSSPVEAPNTLHSTAIARGIDLICEGPIEGLVNGEKSVYINDTPLQNPEGEYNFKKESLSIIPRYGTQDQLYIPDVPSIESEIDVTPGEIFKLTPVVRQISTPNLDALRINIGIPALYLLDVGSGNTSGSKVELTIEVKENGGAYELHKVNYALYTADNAGGIFSLVATDQDVLIWEITIDASSGNPDPVSCNIQYRLIGVGGWTTYQSVQFTSGDIDPTSAVQDSVDNNTYTYPLYGYKTFSLAVSRDQYEWRMVQTTSFPNGMNLSCVGKCMAYSSNIVIEGKTSSEYEASYTVPLNPANGPWDIRVSRLTDDSVSDYLKNKTFWKSYTEIQDEKLTYPNSVLVGFSIDATQFSSIPKRGYDMKLLLIKIPSNYDPILRTYSGNWDGTFTVAWSNNPAWCFYDLVTNSRYGLGGLIDPTLVDKWSLYTIGQYCDELVPTGYKDELGNVIYEPRFTLNILIANRVEAHRVLSDLCSVFRGMAYWAGGNIVAVQDSPKNSIALFNSSNVEDGLFNYSGSAKRARHTVALVKWNDPLLLYKQAIEYIEDQESIVRYGWNSTEVVAVGCTSRGQATRVGKWILYSERYETEVVQFRTGLEGTYLAPGECIDIVDPDRAGKRIGGRIASATVSAVTIDSPILIEVGKTYQLSVMLPTGVIQQRVVTNVPGSFSVLTVSVNFIEAPNQNAIWILSASDLVPQKFRIISISEVSKGILEVTALEYNDGKFDFVEDDLILDPIPITIRPNLLSVLPPATLLVTQESYLVNPQIRNYRLNISWTESPSAYVLKYICETRRSESNWTASVGEDLTMHRTLEGVSKGDYEVRVSTVNTQGIVSRPIFEYITVTDTGGIPPDITNLRVRGPISNQFNTKDVTFEWDSILTDAFPPAFLQHYRIRIYEGATLRREEFTLANEFSYLFSKNSVDGIGPLGTFTVNIVGVSTNSQLSVNPAILNVSNPAPSLPVVTSDYNTNDCLLKWNIPANEDFNYTIIRVYLENARTTLRRTANLGKEATYLYTHAMNDADNPGHSNPWNVYFRTSFVDYFGQETYTDLINGDNFVTNANPSLPVFIGIAGAYESIVINFEPPTNKDWDVVEIWRSTVNNRIDITYPAVKLGEVRGIFFVDGALASNTNYYYWLRSRNTSGNVSGFDVGDTSGHHAITHDLTVSDLGDLVTIDVVSALPSMPDIEYPQGAMVFLTTDDKLYRSTGSAWTRAVSGAPVDEGGDLVRDSITAGSIGAGIVNADHLVANSVVIRNSAQIENLIVNSAHISELTANKISAGTISVLIELGSGNVKLVASQNEIAVFDNQAIPVKRVELGQLGAGTTDYGLKLYDQNGNTTFEASNTLKSRFMQVDGLKMLRVEGPYWPFSTYAPNWAWSAASSDGYVVAGMESSGYGISACRVGLDGQRVGNVVGFGAQFYPWPYSFSCCSFYDYATSRTLTMFVGTSDTLNNIKWWVWDWQAWNYRVAPTNVSVGTHAEYFVFGTFQTVAFFGVNRVQIAYNNGSDFICSIVVDWNTGALIRSAVDSGVWASSSGPNGGGGVATWASGDTGMMVGVLSSDIFRITVLNYDGTRDVGNSVDWGVGTVGLTSSWVPRCYPVLNVLGQEGRSVRTNRTSRWVIASPWDSEILLFEENKADVNNVELYAAIRDWGGPFGGNQPMLHRNRFGREVFPLLMSSRHDPISGYDNLALALVYVDEITSSFKGVRHLSNILTNLTA